MSVSCDPNDLATAARCFDCLPPSIQLNVQTYLLAVIAGGSTDPNTLAAAASAFQSESAQTLAEIRAYLLCQILNAL